MIEASGINPHKCVPVGRKRNKGALHALSASVSPHPVGVRVPRAGDLLHPFYVAPVGRVQIQHANPMRCGSYRGSQAQLCRRRHGVDRVSVKISLGSCNHFSRRTWETTRFRKDSRATDTRYPGERHWAPAEKFFAQHAKRIRLPNPQRHSPLS